MRGTTRFRHIGAVWSINYGTCLLDKRACFSSTRRLVSAVNSVGETGVTSTCSNVLLWRHLSLGAGTGSTETWRPGILVAIHVLRRRINGSNWGTSVGCVYRVDDRLQRVFVESRLPAWLRDWFVLRIWDCLHFDVRRSNSQRADVRAVFNDKSSTTTVQSSEYLAFWVRFHLCCFYFPVVSWLEIDLNGVFTSKNTRTNQENVNWISSLKTNQSWFRRRCHLKCRVVI